MLGVFTGTVHHHDLRLVLVAAAICVLASFTTFAALDQARRSGASRAGWIALTALVSGIGIWSTHFVAMLAYAPAKVVGYDFERTLLSIVAAVGIGGFGWWISSSGRRGAPIAAGLTIGASIAVMHYLGMSALEVGGGIGWDPTLVAASLLIGVVPSIAALSEHRRRPRFVAWRPALLFSLAVCGLHFTGMAAASIEPGAGGTEVAALDGNVLAMIVTIAALLLLLISLWMVAVYRQLARREALERARLKLMEAAVREGDEQRARLSDELRQQVDITSAALDNMAQGLSMYDQDDRLVIFNRRYAELYGMPPEILKPGVPLADLLAYQVATGVLAQDLNFYLHATKDSPEDAIEMEAVLSNGRIIDIKRRRLPGGGWVATHEDITERRRAAEHSAYLASHDALTALPNRTQFVEQLERAIAGLAEGSNFALLSIDLDRFKEVNDTLGHPIGDQLLKQVAARLRSTVRDGETVSRLSGDEFAVLQPLLRQRDDAAALAGRIIAELSRPFAFDGHTVVIGASVGIALAPEHGDSGEELFKKSDLALYRAKSGSKGGFCFFEHGMDQRLRERRLLESDLQVAVQNGQFELDYQPLMRLSDRSITGFEALVRWRHPVRGLLQPSDFITVAEECGLIIPIGEWVLREACRVAAGWPDDVRVAVNLSPAQFKRGDILAMTTNALAAAGLAPDRLELEITESVLLQDENWVRAVLHQLRELGVRIAMDDFGTGYSSLSYLRSFPFSKIKIDQSFIADLVGTRDALAIVQATIQLSEKLGMATTAEGVETAEQMDILAAENCTEVQGFHISRAVPAASVAALLATYRRNSRAILYQVAS